MKEITFTVDENLIEEARQAANYGHVTLDQAFQEWLVEYAKRMNRLKAYDALMERLSYVDIGRGFTREERTER